MVQSSSYGPYAVGTARIRAGSELPAALLDSSITNIELEQDIATVDEDWSSVQPLPIVLYRWVTIQPVSRRHSSILAMNYVHDKIQLGQGGVLNLYRLVLVSWRTGIARMTPGLDILADSIPLPPGVVRPALIINSTVLTYRVCYPYSSQASATAGLHRPWELPGPQDGTYPMPLPTTCTNSTSAPFLERCYAGLLYNRDLAMEGASLSATGATQSAHYTARLVECIATCDLQLTEECMAKHGPVGCYTLVLQALPPQPAVTQDMLDRQQQAGADAGRAAVGNDTAKQSSGQDSGGGDDGAPLQILLPALLGGLAVLALVALAAILLRRRRRQRAQAYQTVKDAGGDGRAPGQPAEGPDVELSRPPPVDCTRTSTPHTRSNTTPDLASDLTVGVLLPPAPLEQSQQAHLEKPAGLAGLPYNLGGEDGTAATAGPRSASTARGHGQVALTATKASASTPSSGNNLRTGPADGLATDGGGSAGHPEVALSLVTPLSPALEGVHLDLVWGVDVQADEDALLGVGAFGRVLVGTYRGSKAAVKMVQGLSARTAARAVQNFRQEVEVLSRCSHPNIVALLGACTTPPHACLVMELMELSLAQLVQEQEGRLPLRRVLEIGVDVAQGLAYLHPTVTHRDLKPANILLSSDGTAKLSDFGLARLRSTVMATAHPEAGTTPYMAPECFAPGNYVITHKADIYALAVLLWELLTGEAPWHGMSKLQVAYSITYLNSRLPLSGLDEARCPHKLRKLIAECWDHDPQRRPSAEEVAKQLMLVRQALERGDQPRPGPVAQGHAPPPPPPQASEGQRTIAAVPADLPRHTPRARSADPAGAGAEQQQAPPV